MDMRRARRCSPRGAAAARRAAAVRRSTDVVRTVARLRAAGHSAGLVPRCSARRGCGRRRRQVRDVRRAHAVHRGGPRAGHPAAGRRAARRPIPEAGIASVADLGCGIGADALAIAALDLGVHAVERDEVTAAIAAYNLAPFVDATVSLGDADDVDLAGVDGVWLDPARRTAGHAETGASTIPRDWSPSLDLAFGAGAARCPTGIKLGPGIDRDLIPDDAEAQWVSVDGEVVETRAVVRRARTAGHPPRGAGARRDGQRRADREADSADAEPGALGDVPLRTGRRRHPGPPDRRSRAALGGPDARPERSRTLDRRRRATTPFATALPRASSGSRSTMKTLKRELRRAASARSRSRSAASTSTRRVPARARR